MVRWNTPYLYSYPIGMLLLMAISYSEDKNIRKAQSKKVYF